MIFTSLDAWFEQSQRVTTDSERSEMSDTREQRAAVQGTPGPRTMAEALEEVLGMLREPCTPNDRQLARQYVFNLMVHEQLKKPDAAAPATRDALLACEEVLRLVHEAAGPVPADAPMPRHCSFDAWRMARAALAATDTPTGGE